MSDYIIIPTIDLLEYLGPAIDDCLAQEGLDTRVLVVSNGSTDHTRERLEELQEHEPRVLCWFHHPPLPSLSASWNAALRFVWSTGAQDCLVVNNDVRLHAITYATLRWIMQKRDALFVSAVGVREGEFNPAATFIASDLLTDHGGPDFSCFLISQAGHWKYPFDENFIPAFCEDLDAHRRYMLGGDGQRIFGVNLPYLHYASRTINRSPEAARRFNEIIGQGRAYYEQKWGGPVNHERFIDPFGPTTHEDVTTPDLQRKVWTEWASF